MKIIAFILFFVFRIYILKGQESGTSRFYSSDIYIKYGSLAADDELLSSEDFMKLVPAATPDRDYYTDVSLSARSFAGSFTVLTAWRAGHDLKANPAVRLGLTGWRGGERGMYLSGNETIGSDTLYSLLTGQQLISDTLLTRTLNYSYQNSGIQLDFSIVFGTGWQKRWNLFAGAGGMAGTTLDARTLVDYYATEKVSFRGSGELLHSGVRGVESRRDLYRNKSSFVWSLYVPAGIDFSVGNHANLWRRIKLLYEFRIGIASTSVAEINPAIHSFLSHEIGIRLELNSPAGN